ncbi:MAG: copper resistance CopC/CopD family protein [Acidimicrobiales bacterium]
MTTTTHEPRTGHRRTPSGNRSRPTRWAFAAASAVAAVVATSLLAPISPVAAHAVVLAVSPPAGSLLADAPVEVSITFNEVVGVEADSLVVIDADGTRVSEPARAEGSTVSAALASDVEGWHAVSWWAVSADGHPVSGAWTFRVGDGTDEAPEGLEDRAMAAARSGDAARWSYYVAQWVSTAATVVAVGAAFLALLAPPGVPRRRFLLAAAGVAAVASLVAAGLNGPYAAVGRSFFDGPASAEYLARGAAMAAVAGLAVALGRDSVPRVPVAGMATVAGAVGLAVPVLSGHAATEGASATFAVMAHVVVAGAWLGAVPALLLAIHTAEPGADRLLGRFSRAATWLLAVTITAGLGGTWLLTGGPGQVAQTWGWILFVKVSLIGVAVTAGAWNRWNVVPVTDRHGGTPARPALAVECLALVGVLLASVALTHNGPPRDTGGGRGDPVVIDETFEDGERIQVIIEPARVGPNDLHVFVLDPVGLPLSAEELTVTVSSSDLGIGEIDVPMSNLGAGHYTTRFPDLGLAGTWQVTVQVRPDPFSLVELVEEFEVRG